MLGKKDSKFSLGQLILVISSVSCEYYLFSLFIILAPQISHDLIPIADKQWRELFALSIFLVAGICRPLGGVIFSGFGESYNRYQIFFISTIIMSVSSILLGLLPSAKDIGIIAPIILLLIRIGQGIVVGAVVPESLVYCYQATGKKLRVFATSLINIACSFGFVIAILFTIMLESFAGKETWRIGMVACGIFNLILGYQLRNTFVSYHTQPSFDYTPLKNIFKDHKLNLLRLICFASFLSSGAAVFIYFMPNYLFSFFHFSRHQIHLVSLFEISGYILGQLAAAFMHERLNKNFYITSGFFFKALLVFTFHSYARHSLSEAIVLNTICCFVFGFFVAKLPVIMISAFPRKMRFAGVGLVFNTSFGVMFGVSQYIIMWLIQTTKSLYMPSIYIVFFSYISLISLWFMSQDIFYRYNRNTM